MRISDWSSDVCSSDLRVPAAAGLQGTGTGEAGLSPFFDRREHAAGEHGVYREGRHDGSADGGWLSIQGRRRVSAQRPQTRIQFRAEIHAHSEEHKSERQSLMRTSNAVFCSKKKKL